MPLAYQVIQLRGRPVAMTVGTNCAAIRDEVDEEEVAVVRAMCTYALEVAGGDRPGPYSDAAAERHARRDVALQKALRNRVP